MQSFSRNSPSKFFHHSQFTLKNFYSYFMENETDCLHAIAVRRVYKWPQICQNLALMKEHSILYFLLIKLCYSLELAKGIIDSDICRKCGQVDDLLHNLIACLKKYAIWEKFKDVYVRVNRCHREDITVDQTFCRPSYHYFPPMCSRFSIWLIAINLYILKNERNSSDAEWYSEYVLLSYWNSQK